MTELDLSKYDGYTEPWPYAVGWWTKEQDRRLIIDAPLLLAELKRLREELRRTSDREDRIGAEFTALRQSHARLLKEMYFQRERWVLLKQVPDDPADQAACAIRNLDAVVAEAEKL